MPAAPTSSDPTTVVPADPWPAPRARVAPDVVVDLPGSKSLTNRALLLAAVADGPSTVVRALRSRDTLLMAGALRGLGTDVDTSGSDWVVTPGALRGGTTVDCGLAGTVMRFVPPVAGLADGPVAFDGDAHMRNRPVGPVLGALRDLGVDVTGDALPFTVRGTGSVAGGRTVVDASGSSQFVSALLLAGARYDAGVEVVHEGPPVPSLPHIDMTVAALRAHGVEVDSGVDGGVDGGRRWAVAPGPVRAHDHRIEPDLSNAGPFLALAAATGGRVTVRDWPATTTQAGDALRDLLARMGCTVDLGPDGLTVRGPQRLTGIDADLHDVGELTPVVAALCALADGPSRLRGVAHIRAHETDRLAALAAELGGLGADVTEHEDGLALRPAPLHGGVFRTYADHRMAHAGVVVGAVVDGVSVEDVATTGKTFPDFAGAWSALFADGV